MENGNENEGKNATEGADLGANKKSYALPVAILVAGLLIAGAVAFRSDSGFVGNGSGKTAVKDSGVVATVGKTAITADDDPVLGNPNAPVTLIDFGDFRCRYCKLFQETIKPTIMEKYVKTGKVKYVYRDLITMGNNSILAAGGANCSGKQGKYWEFADALHSGKPGMIYTEKSLSEIAVSLGLDAEKFKQCLDAKEYVKEIEKDTEDARAAGATGTPTVFINGRIIVGLASLGEYEKIIDEELAKAAAEGK